MLRRLKSLRKPLAIICIAGLVVALAGVGVSHVWDAAALRQLEDTRSELRAQGLAVAFGDLRGVPPPEEENAAPLYEAVFRQLEEEEVRLLEEFDLSLSLLEPWHVEEALASKLASNEALVESLRRAAARPRCAFRIEYRDLATPLPHIPRLRQAMNFIVTHTAERARAGDVEAAFEGVRIAARMARALEEEPLVIGQVVRMGLNAQVLEALEVLLPLADDPVGQLRLIDPDGCRGAAWRGLRGEVIVFLDMAAAKAGDLARAIAPNGSLFVRLKVPMFRSDLASAAKRIARELDAENLPYPEQLRAREEVLRDVNANPQLIVTRFLVPVVLQSIAEEARNASRVAMARLAAELLAFRRRKGAFPEAIAMLGLDGAAIIDPYTEKPFRLLRRDEGTWVASDAAPLDDEKDIRWVFEDEEGEFAWARWRVDAPLPPRSRPEGKRGVQALKGIAESLGIRVPRRGLTEEEWFEKVKAEVEAAGVGIQFGADDGKANRDEKDGGDHKDPLAEK